MNEDRMQIQATPSQHPSPAGPLLANGTFHSPTFDQDESPTRSDLDLLVTEEFSVIDKAVDEVFHVIHACVGKVALEHVRAIGSHQANDQGLIDMPSEWSEAWSNAMSQVDGCVDALNAVFAELTLALAECMSVARAQTRPASAAA